MLIVTKLILTIQIRQTILKKERLKEALET